MQTASLPDQLTHKAMYMVNLIDQTTHPWSALLLAVHHICSIALSQTGFSPIIAFYALELSRLLAPGGDPSYFPAKLVDTAVGTFQQLWLDILQSHYEDRTVAEELTNSAKFLVDLFAFGLMDDKRMIECLEWLVNEAGLESIEQMNCLEVLLERLRQVASSGKSLPFDFVQHRMRPNVVSAWKDGMEKMILNRREGSCRALRFTAFSQFHDELFSTPSRKLRVGFLAISRTLADLSSLATKATNSQLSKSDKLVFILGTQAECHSGSCKLMERLMSTTLKDVVLDDVLDENTLYLAQMHRMLRDEASGCASQPFE